MKKVRLSKKQKVLSTAIVFVIVVIITFILWAKTDKQAHIINAPTRIAAEDSQKQYDGKYIQFTYQGMYDLQQKTAKDNDLEVVLLNAFVSYHKQLAVAVQKLDGGLQNNSAYRLRQSQPENYSLETKTAGNVTVHFWYRTDGSEVTVQIPHRGMVAVLSFTATSGFDAMRQEANDVVESLIWRQQ